MRTHLMFCIHIFVLGSCFALEKRSNYFDDSVPRFDFNSSSVGSNDYWENWNKKLEEMMKRFSLKLDFSVPLIDESNGDSKSPTREESDETFGVGYNKLKELFEKTNRKLDSSFNVKENRELDAVFNDLGKEEDFENYWSKANTVRGNSNTHAPSTMVPWFAGVVLVFVLVIMMCVCMSAIRVANATHTPSPPIQRLQAARSALEQRAAMNSATAPRIYIDVETIRRIVQERDGTSPTISSNTTSPSDLPPSYDTIAKEMDDSPPPKYEEYFSPSKPV